MIEEPPRLIVRKDRRRPTRSQIDAFAGVPTGFVVDAMFGRGALDARIGPLGGHTRHIAGPALTADNRPSDMLGTLGALNYLQDGDVLLGGAQGWQGCAAAGDRLCGMARNAGAAAFVTDGPMRDLDGIEDVGLPAWCTGLTPASPFTTGPATIGAPMAFGGQYVATGDMVVADRDGVVVVPFDLIDTVIARLDDIRRMEGDLDAEVRDGLSLPDAFRVILDSDQTRHE